MQYKDAIKSHLSTPGRLSRIRSVNQKTRIYKYNCLLDEMKEGDLQDCIGVELTPSLHIQAPS